MYLVKLSNNQSFLVITHVIIRMSKCFTDVLLNLSKKELLSKYFFGVVYTRGNNILHVAPCRTRKATMVHCREFGAAFTLLMF